MLEFSFQFAQMILTVKNSILVRMENAVSYSRNNRITDFIAKIFVYLCVAILNHIIV